MKRGFPLLWLTLLLFGSLFSFGFDSEKNIFTINKYKKMTAQQLLDCGDAFANNNIKDSALICYSLIYNSNVSGFDTLSKQIVCKAMNRASRLYFQYTNYTLSLDLLLRSLDMCESIGYNEYIGRIYNNIGNVHYYFKDYKLARKYYQLAYDNANEKYLLAISVNNLGILAKEDENDLEAALSLYKEAARFKSESGDNTYNFAFNNIGIVYQAMKQYDSAVMSYRLGLRSARLYMNEDSEALILSNMGGLHFELNSLDSATYYFNISSRIGEKIKLSKILSTNYLYLSKILETKGRVVEAFALYKKHSIINDSLYNDVKHLAINELQFMHNMSKVDKQIEAFSIEQQIKDRTILMQRRLQIVMGLVLLIVIMFLILLYSKNKNLNKAYNVLVEKNIEIVNYDKFNEKVRKEYEDRIANMRNTINTLMSKVPQETEGDESEEFAIRPVSIEKYKNSSLKDDYKDELVNAILNVMENKEVFCDPDFSIDKLVLLIGSNQNYVSQVINDTFKKSFRSFINDYRIKEARKILSDPECKKYTIESIGVMVGFKSRRTFDSIFKEITGISPSFYLKSQNSS